MTVTDAGWVDTGSFRPNPGQFPIRVERHLNAFVGSHLPGVTTVTSAARYYALHGLLAQTVADEDLDEGATLKLLRRSEALLAYVTRVHSTSADHDPRTPAPHGIDAIMRNAQESAGIDLARAAQVYSEAKWAFSNPYRGSELTLKILEPGGFKPGEWYDHTAATSVLAPIVEVARGADEVAETTAADLSSACLCTTQASADGAWLANLMSGEPTQDSHTPTVGGLLWQFGRTVAVATTVGDVTDANTFADLLMFDPTLREHPKLEGLVAPLRWRGALLRKESVYAWRLIWRDINRLVGGARPVDELVDAFVDQLPSIVVAAFRATLPARLDASGNPRPAERELQDLPDLHQWMAQLMLGADRLSDLSGPELLGFRGRFEHEGGLWDELSPGWVANQLDRYASHSLKDLGRHVATALLNRSQRVALFKARYDVRTQVLTYPARLRLRDGLAVKIYEETAPVPATRIPQYLSITRQAGMFTVDGDGRLTVGPNGGRLV